MRGLLLGAERRQQFVPAAGSQVSPGMADALAKWAANHGLEESPQMKGQAPAARAAEPSPLERQATQAAQALKKLFAEIAPLENDPSSQHSPPGVERSGGPHQTPAQRAERLRDAVRTHISNASPEQIAALLRAYAADGQDLSADYLRVHHQIMREGMHNAQHGFGLRSPDWHLRQVEIWMYDAGIPSEFGSPAGVLGTRASESLYLAKGATGSPDAQRFARELLQGRSEAARAELEQALGRRSTYLAAVEEALSGVGRNEPKPPEMWDNSGQTAMRDK